MIAHGTNGGPSLNNDDQFGGRAVANIGDLDGDGINDLAVGAYLDDSGSENRGALYIQFMNANGTVRNFTNLRAASTEPRDCPRVKHSLVDRCDR